MIKIDKGQCPCLSCIYLVHAAKINEKPKGEYDLRINCGISGCPEGVMNSNKKVIKTVSEEDKRKIFDCVEMLKRCVEIKSKQELYLRQPDGKE